MVARPITALMDLLSVMSNPLLVIYGNVEKFPPWSFYPRKVRMRLSLFLCFQSLIVIEKGVASMPRSGIPIFRDALVLVCGCREPVREAFSRMAMWKQDVNFCAR